MAVVGQDVKQPVDVDDKDIDFSQWMPAGDALDYAQTQVRLLSGPAAPALMVDKVVNTAVVSKVWISGGAHGAKWRVSVTAHTLRGRTKQVEFDIKVKEF